jgi:hypothetical protein
MNADFADAPTADPSAIFSMALLVLRLGTCVTPTKAMAVVSQKSISFSSRECGA